MAPAVIYLVTNTENGKRYVGVTRYTVAKRWGEHRTGAATGRRGALYAAMRKYGEAAFTVEQVASCLTLGDANTVERAVIDALRPEYNMTNGGEFTIGRRALSKEAAERIRAAHVGKTITPEQRAQISRTLKARHASDPAFREAALAALAAGRKRIDLAKQRAAASASAKGRVWSDDSRRKLSQACMGRTHSPDIVKRIAAKKCKAVECTTLNATFDSMSDAAGSMGIHVSTISKVCLGKRASAHGLNFQFVGV